jgi:hypothetical protein
MIFCLALLISSRTSAGNSTQTLPFVDSLLMLMSVTVIRLVKSEDKVLLLSIDLVLTCFVLWGAPLTLVAVLLFKIPSFLSFVKERSVVDEYRTSS